MIWNDGLDDEFKTIAGYKGSHSCIIAGAGTGKSFALKRKVARFLEDGEQPVCILAITFTRTAARDIGNDLHQLGLEGCDLIKACTLHSLCYSILAKHEVFTVMQRQTRTLLKHEESFLIADLSVRLDKKIEPLKEQLHAFTSAWARLLNEEPGWPHTSEDRAFDSEMISWLRFHRAMLIGELIPLTIRYLRNNPVSPERSEYKHIIIDEYQDLNKAEQKLARLLSEYEKPRNRTLTAAGDDDQSIFGTLKYAHPEGILNFKREYPEALLSTLTTCQRCPKKVIDLANAFIISTNRKENPKLLNPAENAIDGEVAILQWRLPRNEAAGIARVIAHRVNIGEVRPEQILVLTPRKQIGYAVSKSLNDLGIKARTCFSDAVLEGKQQAQEGYAYLNLLHDNEDAVSLRVLLGIDKQDKRKRSYERVRQHCYTSGDSMIRALSRLQSGELSIPYTDSLVERYADIDKRLRGLSELSIPDIIDQLFPDNIQEVADIRELVLSAKEQANDIHELFKIANEEIVQPALPELNDSVLVLTLHKAKGLTAEMVVVVNCLEGCIPSVRDAENLSLSERDLKMAEQERLFFVALTRTRKILMLSSTGIIRRGEAAKMSIRTGSSRYWPQTQASRFIDMLGPEAPNPEPGEDYVRRMVGSML
ncbi:UvrD-helicase domain-containing protein [Chloroflexota bacterium]